MEILGIKPRILYMQNMSSTTELHPQTGVMLGNKSCQCITKEIFLNQKFYLKNKYYVIWI